MLSLNMFFSSLSTAPYLLPFSPHPIPPPLSLSIQPFVLLSQVHIEPENVADVTDRLADILDTSVDLTDVDVEIVADVIDRVSLVPILPQDVSLYVVEKALVLLSLSLLSYSV